VRAAEAFGATGAAMCAAQSIGTADPFGPKALRASAGSALRLPIVSGIAPSNLIAQMQGAGVKVYAAVAADVMNAATDSKRRSFASGTNSLLLWDIDWKAPAAILIGNEGAGLPAEVVRAADARVSIPQAASRAVVGIESLNAAMAASVLLYEAMRQRNATGRTRA
jgi:TrmH family RNA methyltransferase